MMTVARTVADVVTEHTVFEVECIDRMYLNVYQPKLQYATGIIGYLRGRLDSPIASTMPLGKISDRFTRAVHRFAQTEGIEWVDFARGERKDDVMLERLKRGSPHRRVWCSSGGLRRRTRCSAPRSGTTRTGRCIRGS
jgi:hypothetical protein